MGIVCRQTDLFSASANADGLGVPVTLQSLVSGYFDFAEIQAIKRSPMYMSDYIHHLDLILSTTGEQVLQNAGTISHEQAKQKALGEYQKYHVKTLSPVEEAYFDSIKKLTAETKKKKKK